MDEDVDKAKIFLLGEMVWMSSAPHRANGFAIVLALNDAEKKFGLQATREALKQIKEEDARRKEKHEQY